MCLSDNSASTASSKDCVQGQGPSLRARRARTHRHGHAKRAARGPVRTTHSEARGTRSVHHHDQSSARLRSMSCAPAWPPSPEKRTDTVPYYNTPYTYNLNPYNTPYFIAPARHELRAGVAGRRRRSAPAARPAPLWPSRCPATCRWPPAPGPARCAAARDALMLAHAGARVTLGVSRG